MPEQAIPTTRTSRKSLKTAAGTWRLIQEDFMAGHAHKAAGKPVVWSCAVMDKEIYHAMGVFGFYPEQFASPCAVQRAAVGAEKYAVRYARIAEEHGYSPDLCGYHRVGMGYVINGDLADGPLGGVPAPDLLVTTSSVCDLRLKWWEDMAQRLSVPMFILDRPDRSIEGQMETPKPYELRYCRSQLQDLIAFITSVTGIKYDEDRLNECMDWSYKTSEVRLEIMELRKAVPSPMSSADGFATIYPGMYLIGTEKAYRYYQALRDEVKARVDGRQGQIEGERFRLMWMGIPTWFNTGIFNYFEPRGGVFAYEPYYNPYAYPPRTPEDPLTEIALRWLMANQHLVRGAAVGLPEICREFQIDGL
ncbi:MAG: 2-hydroxyacyl-CoA dehydratase family protein, partial [Chloroflexi bacterium]|nr:2-hydroxyacyl-CoA dehydratase family protein [Chloroflexota bacterium]